MKAKYLSIDTDEKDQIMDISKLRHACYDYLLYLPSRLSSTDYQPDVKDIREVYGLSSQYLVLPTGRVLTESKKKGIALNQNIDCFMASIINNAPIFVPTRDSTESRTSLSRELQADLYTV